MKMNMIVRASVVVKRAVGNSNRVTALMINFSCLKLLTVDRIQQFCVLPLLELFSRCVWFSVILHDTALTFVEVLTTLSLSVEMNRSTSVVGWSSPSGTWKTVKRVVVTRLGGGGRKGGGERDGWYFRTVKRSALSNIVYLADRNSRLCWDLRSAASPWCLPQTL